MTIELKRTNLTEVISWDYFHVDLIDPRRQLHIMSGIAVPAFEVDDDSQDYTGDCKLNLEVTLPDFQEAVCQVGLASIHKGAESEFKFELGAAKVEPDDSLGGALVLHISPMTARGIGTGLHSFGFQVVALTGKRPTGVTGNLRWSKNIFDATGVSDGNALAAVAASIQTGSGEIIGLGILGSVFREGDDFSVRYQFDDLPLNVPLQLSWRLAPLSFPDCFATQLVPPPVLTVDNPVATNIDFRVNVSRLR